MAPPPAAIPDYNDPANASADFQGYLDPSDEGGIDVRYAWTLPGGTGAAMQICDVEYDFNPSHVDLMPYFSIELVGGEPVNDNNAFRNHGTAVMSILRGNDEGFGVKGIVHDANAKFSPQHVAGWFTQLNTADAVMRAIFAVDFGDVIVLETQMFGPNAPQDGTQLGLVPSEWDPAVFDAINAATGVGRIVVEAAGNGTQNLDSGAYSSNNNGHYPFMPGNESGAIIVGAGFAPDTVVPDPLIAIGITSLARMKTTTSNFGQRVDVQNWGNNVVAAGYGDLLKEGESAYYTQFSGTSSATAITAGAVTSLQGICKARWGRTLWAFEMRNVLKIASLPQVRRPDTAVGTPNLNVGPLPNLKVAADLILGTLPAPILSPMPADGDPPITLANPKIITLDLDPGLDPTVLPDAFILLYTTDGTEPDTNGWGYDNGGVGFIHTPGDSIELTESVTIKARVILPNLQNDGLLINIWATSYATGAVYGPSIPAPVVDIAGGAYPNTLFVDLRTGMGDSPYIIYTLDGSEPDVNSNYWEGDPTQVWTNTMSDNGARLNVFAYGSPVTLKARNVVYYGGAVGEVAGEMLIQTYTQSLSTSP